MPIQWFILKASFTSLFFEKKTVGKYPQRNPRNGVAPNARFEP
jgi:hypothetical protein